MEITLDTDMLAKVMGTGFAIAGLAGGESVRTEFYSEVYLPLTLALQATNSPEHPWSDMDTLNFSFKAARAEHSYISAALR